MSLRGQKHRTAIVAVLDAFSSNADQLVLVGSSALALYARPSGAPLRATKDVDCVSTLLPWSRQNTILGRMCEQRILAPDSELLCRYRIVSSGVDVDVLSLDGTNVGGINPWFEPAVKQAKRYEVVPTRWIRSITPAFFLATKLAAFVDRAADPMSSEDLEDIITLAVEVDDLVVHVADAGIAADVSALWGQAMAKHGLRPDSVADVVSWHLHREDADAEMRVVDAICVLVAGS